MKYPTKIVNIKHSKCDVFIGRPSKWGNPFEMETEADRDKVIQEYREWIVTQPQLLEEAYEELRNKRLGCFCRPKACHGDVLKEHIDRITREKIYGR